MWLHPDGIARTTRWEHDDRGGMPLWKSVIEQISESTGIEKTEIKLLIIDQLPLYQNLLNEMIKLNISDEIINNSQHRINNICQQIQELTHG